MNRSVRRLVTAVALTAVTSTAVVLFATPALARTIEDCDNGPGAPDWFYPHLKNAADNPNDDVPSSWGTAVAMAKIVCFESDFDQHALNDDGPYYGLGQLSRPAIDATRVSFTCYWHGGCAKDRRYHQLLAALRYARQVYDNPQNAWAHMKLHRSW